MAVHWQDRDLNPYLGILHLLLPDYSLSATQLALLKIPSYQQSWFLPSLPDT